MAAISPVSSSELKRRMGRPIAIARYNELANSDISSLLNNEFELIIFLQGRNRIGHWTAIKVFPSKHEIDFFSSYGFVPDYEKNKFVPECNIPYNVLARWLHTAYKAGWNICYNEVPYQKIGDGTTSCGAWVVFFLKSGLTVDEFNSRIRRSYQGESYEPYITYIWNKI